MERQAQERPPSLFRTLYYWIALLITLTVVDDWTFGWFFWALSQYDLVLSAVLAFTIYWALGYWITLRGLTPNPGKVAGWFLNRLQLGHTKNHEIHSMEERLQAKITSIGLAVPMSLLFGGVFTTLWLRRRQLVDDQSAKRLGLLLCGLFAIEVAAIHAFGIGGLILYVRHHA